MQKQLQGENKQTRVVTWFLKQSLITQSRSLREKNNETHSTLGSFHLEQKFCRESITCFLFWMQSRMAIINVFQVQGFSTIIWKKCASFLV